MSRERIWRLALVFVAAAVVVLLGLFQLAVVDHDVWLERSYRNRWAFKDVPTRRGGIVDRNGVPLAWDAPGFDLELTYHQFRREHPVGALRHGADLARAARGVGQPSTYEARDRLARALDELLAVPARALWRADEWRHADAVPGYANAPHDVAVDVRFYTLTAVATLGGVPRHRLGLRLGEVVLGEDRDESVAAAVVRCAELDADLAPLRGSTAALRQRLHEALAERIEELDSLDARLLMRAAGIADDGWSLWSRLERAHADWAEWQRVLRLRDLGGDAEREVEALLSPDFWRYLHESGWQWRRWDDWLLLPLDERRSLVTAFTAALERRLEERFNEGAGRDRFVAVGVRQKPLFPPLPEDVEAPRFRDPVRPIRIRARLEHEAAVWLALLADRHPGFDLRPSVRRERGRLPGSDDLGSLGPLVGSVGAYAPDGRSPEYDALRRLGGASDFARVERGLPDELEESLRRSAVRTLRTHYAIFGRIGRSGVERVRDDVLSGRPGLRFVERDKRARETRMFERLDVSPGEPVAMTIDVRLQAIAERAVGAPLPDTEIALAVIEPTTGDVLALVGKKHRAEFEAGEAPEVWTNGATPPAAAPYVGSVAKPLVALEYLHALHGGATDVAGRLVPPSAFAVCAGGWSPGGSDHESMLYCGSRLHPHSHGHKSHDTTAAIAVSCNTYFYEAASRLGRSGLDRAYARFGWTPLQDDVFGERVYQQRVAGMAPNWSGGPKIEPDTGFGAPHLGIGYGLHVWPTFVARAYAGIATGALPRLRIVLDEAPEAVPLPYDEASLAIVRAGLERCVRGSDGTARRELADFAARLEAAAGVRLFGKTGTAVVQTAPSELNNAWFAGYVAGPDGARLAFAAAYYRTADGGGTAAAPVVRVFLDQLLADPELVARYLHGGTQR